MSITSLPDRNGPLPIVQVVSPINVLPPSSGIISTAFPRHDLEKVEVAEQIEGEWTCTSWLVSSLMWTLVLLEDEGVSALLGQRE